DLSDNIAEPRLGMDGDRLTSGISINAAIGRAAEAGDLREVAPTEPGREVELLSVFAIRMDADAPCASGTEHMHRVGEHDRTLVEMMFVRPFRFSDPVRRWRQGRHEIFEVQPSLPGGI